MHLTRRAFVQSTAAAGAAVIGESVVSAQGRGGGGGPVPASIQALKPLPNPPAPITDDERRARIAKAQRLMTEQGIGAIVLEGGASMSYFVNVRWGLSERPFLLVIPAKGELAYVTPGFEENRAREITKFTNDVRVWQEDEDWGKVVAGILKDRGVTTGKVGVEERLRFFIADGIRAAAPGVQFVLGTPVTAGCRMIKSPAEIALMQRANDITIEAYRAAFATLAEGMTQFEFGRNIRAAFEALGAPGGSAGVQFGEYSAFPHGSITPQKLKSGDVVLCDGGCGIEGYQSDITRTTVFGKPSQKQLDVWNLEKQAQAAAFKAAQVGATCESVDAAARKVIVDAGYGPDYKYFTHRVGHGMGMDGHEWPYLVRGNKLPLRPGMTFSDEPGIYLRGEFGVRLEDDMVITEDGARLFTPQSNSLEQPF